MRRALIAVGMLTVIIATSTLISVTSATAACETPTPVPSATAAAISVQIPDATTTPIPPCVDPTTTTAASAAPSGSGTSGGGGRGRGSGLATTGDTAPAPDGAPVVGSSPSETGNRLELDHERISAGEWMTATGNGFGAGEQVQLVLYSEPVVIDSYVADGGGSFTARFRIPEKTRSGIHTLEATGWQTETVANAEFVVVTQAVATGGIPQVWWLLIVLGALLIALIVTLIYFRRSIAAWLAPTAIAGGQAT